LNAQTHHNLKNSLIISSVIIAACDLIFLLFALSSYESYFFIPLLWDLATVPFWFIAFIDIALKRKYEVFKDNTKVTKNEGSLFEDSYEHVLIKKQLNVFNKILTPLCVLISISIFSIISYSSFTQNYSFSTTAFTSAAIACLFAFKAILIYNIAKYLKGLTQETKLSSVATLSGVGFYQLFFLILCICGILGHSTSFIHLPAYTLYGISFLSLYYILEIFVRSVLSFYGLLSSPFSPQCPSIITLKDHRVIGKETKNIIQYQFGDLTKSQSYFQNKAINLSLFFITCIILSTSIKKVDLGNVAYIEFLGNPSKKVEAGYHLIPPWPLGNLRSINTEKILRISSGSPDLNSPVIWKENHNSNETYYLVQVSSDNKNLPVEDYAINSVLSYRIDNPYNYLYKHKDPSTILNKLLERCISFNLITNTTHNIFGEHKTILEKNMKSELNDLIIKYELGVRLVDFSIIQIHPPKDTVESFESTISARIDKDDTMLKAQTYKRVTELEISAMKIFKLSNAETIVTQLKNDYIGELTYFNHVLPIYKILGHNFLLSKSLDLLPSTLKNMKKIFVLSEHNYKVIDLNLEQPLDPDILDLSLKASEE
jgi:modulator of FtsH protease HflK